MNKQLIISQLESRYPGKTIICNPEDNPSEIICELEPQSDHPNWSLVIAVIDSSVPHHHKISAEEYKVLTGDLQLFIDNQEFLLKPGDTKIINPGQKHHAKGNETWIQTTSHPGWTIYDHVLDENE